MRRNSLGTKAPKIAVLGSVNMDLVARCTNLPSPGQTLTASSFEEIPGGKGANQAVAARRAGGDVTMIGRLGDDGFAERLRSNLVYNEVDCECLTVCRDTPSGAAMIAVADSGENQIIVIPGANGNVTVGDVQQAARQIQQADVLLLQLEIPVEAVAASLALAREAGTKVVLDPAPALTPFPSVLFQVDLICPNVSEAAALIQSPVRTTAEIENAARCLHDRGAKAVAITLGESGTAFFDGQEFSIVAPYKIQTADTTAAGDAFAGSLAVHWAETEDLSSAIRFGNAAGALAASRHGAQPSLPLRREILHLMDKPG
jgi:ribokinase